MTVKLGDFEFDPVKPNDFRLSIEGASGSGKSNTLAVILEDLKDRNWGDRAFPTSFPSCRNITLSVNLRKEKRPITASIPTV